MGWMLWLMGGRWCFRGYAVVTGLCFSYREFYRSRGSLSLEEWRVDGQKKSSTVGSQLVQKRRHHKRKGTSLGKHTLWLT